LAPNLFHLTACDFYFWESLKDKAYTTNPAKKGHTPRDFPSFRARTPDSKELDLPVY